MKNQLSYISGMLIMLFLASIFATASDRRHNGNSLVLTSTNDASANQVVVFKLSFEGTPSLTLVNILPTGGKGGAGGNAGAVQFRDSQGAVVNYGSNTLSRLVRDGGSVHVAGAIPLAPNCVQPLSVALNDRHAFVVGSNCAESHSWPSGYVDGTTVSLPDNSAAQIVTGESWSAVTLKSGSVVALGLTARGALNGSSSTVTLPANANNTPLGAAFWGDILGFTPAHSPDSFALVNKTGDVFPVLGPEPAYPTNAPCWLAKGAGNVWYAGNSPAQTVSIFFSDGQGGTFYKSVPVGGVPTDVSVSPDGNWLAVIFTASDGSGGRISVFSIDAYGDLSLAATSDPVGIASFNGVAFSQ
ncbi:MAG TPA: hypothetical protein VJP02_02980 [Candidatus Sulfotelmatobacter sp.]|nr:hypothetical protein [Candidatus Sulfotelmatobacter sp.]